MSAALSLGLSLVAGCQEPFGTDRHELAGFRIAALTLSAGPDPLQVQPHAVTVVSGRLWTDDPVRLRWHWFETASTEAILNLTPDTPALGEGPAPTLQLPASGGVIALVASTAAGDIRRAWIDVPSDGPSEIVG